MANDKEFQQRVQRIGALVQEIDTIADPAVRASTTQLVQLIMEFHGSGLDRALEILADAGEPGMELIDRLGHDPMVGSLLVLYGLHPETLETRVTRAVERLEPKLRKDGAAVQLLEIADGTVRVRVTPSAHACGSTTKTLQSTVEDAIYEAAPDLTSLSVEGLEGKSASGFVALSDLAGPAPVSADLTAPEASPMAANYGD
jgi:Fe-S cluster biogenesis protein NfuA